MASGSGIETNRIRHFVKMDQRSFFLAGACTECHKIPSEDIHMKACSKCRLVWYCGKECQKNNWAYHKKLCKAISSFATALRGPGSYALENAKEAVEQGMDFHDYLMCLVNAVCGKLKRTTDILETKIIMSPKVCEICKDANPAVLKPCNICYMIFYCSEKHAKQDSVRHRKFCPEYFLSLQCYHLVATKGMPLPGAMPFRIPRVSQYKPMSGTMKDYIKPTFDSDIDACLSDWVSYPLSLVYALEHTGLNNGTTKVCEVKELTILMCDAFNAIFGSMDHCSTWEYMLHFLPKLKKLNVILREPDNGCISGDYGTRDVDLCSKCISRKCKVNIILIKDYHTYKWCDGFKKPDVIYNHEITTRDETIKYLPFPEPEIPLILLSADKETMERSFRVMKKKEKLDILLPLQINPFRGMRPTKVPRDYMEDGGFIQYSNCYIAALRRQVKEGFTRIRLTPP